MTIPGSVFSSSSNAVEGLCLKARGASSFNHWTAMALQKFRFKVPPEMAGLRLDDALIALLKGKLTSKAQARKLIVAGAVYLNGRRVRIASKPVIVGASIEAMVDFAKLETGAQKSVSHRQGWELGPDSVLFEDDYLIAINKPAGLPTQPTLDEARLNLFAALQKYVRERDKNPQAYIGLHHRLDRDTSGVVLFTKRKEANAGVADLFSKHLAQKEYRALTTGSRIPEQKFEIKNHLKRAPGKHSRFTAVRSGGDFAHTLFETVGEVSKGIWEFKAWPRTGRTHQIRVHLSEHGYPIIGDLNYGGAQTRFRLMLHARSLTFKHPVTGADLVIESPIPKDFEDCRTELSCR